MTFKWLARGGRDIVWAIEVGFFRIDDFEYPNNYVEISNTGTIWHHLHGCKKKAVKYISPSLPGPLLDDSSMNSLYHLLIITVTFFASLCEIPISSAFLENNSFKYAAIANQKMNTSAAFACGDSRDQRDCAISSTIVMY